MRARVQSSAHRDLRRRSLIVASVLLLLSWSAAANAQIWRAGNSIGDLEPGITMRGSDTAYDPVFDVYLLVVGHGPIYGIFVNAAGIPVTPAFTIMDGTLGWGNFPRAKYSPHVPNGVGGFGGFIVAWHHNIGAINCVFSRIVSYPAGRPVTNIQQISDGAQNGSWHETGPALAYSRTSQRFLIAWRTNQYAIHGRFVDRNGFPAGPVMALENPGASRDPALTWNSVTDEFGLVYTGWDGGAHASFRRIRASDGAVSPRSAFGYAGGTYATAIDVNTWSNQYILTWALHPGTMAAAFDAGGTYLGTSLVTTRLGFDQSLAMSFNPLSGTFLAVSSDINSFEVAGVELAATGQPYGLVQILTNGARGGSFYPMTSNRPSAGEWDIVYSRDFRGATSQIVGTSTRGGGITPGPAPGPTPPPPTGCTTPDPFVSIGGGTCVNGGWVPRGTSAPAPTPTPAPPPPTGCSIPDPFASLGGGTCVNGGWLPPGSPAAPAPAPAPPPTGCTTPDPFTSIGGGSCVNGGWIPAVSSCKTPNPFASLGTGRCVNGGWVPW
jgi:hypothetical protein